jgi:cation:H+ antiporter
VLTLVAMFAAGLILLLVGGRLLVSAAEDAATRLGVAPLVVGLTLVAWGTSAPELALNLISASKARSDLAVGNLVGANICNMALVLGACAIVRPLRVEERLVRVEILVNAAMLVAFAALGLLDGFGRGDGALMLGLFALYSAWTVRAALKRSRRPAAATLADGVAADASRAVFPLGWTMIAACFIGGLVLLSIGGSLTSDPRRASP